MKNPRLHINFPVSSTAFAFLLLSQAPSGAALLLYEGFNGYGTNNQLSTITPNANTVGLATSGTGSSYANATGNSAVQPTTMTIQASGLTLGALTVSGGAVSSTSTPVLTSAIIDSTTSSSVIWGSYLVNLGLISGTTSGSSGFEIRLNATSNSSAGSNDVYFRSQADSRNSSGSPAISYASGLVNGTSDLTASTTYLIISKFDTGASGSARLWALDAAQFADFVAAGRSEAYLDTASGVFQAASAQSGSKGWNTAGTPAYLEFVSVNSTNTFDEIRYGESLLDVAPIPEPSAGLLVCGAALAGAFRRRR